MRSFVLVALVMLGLISCGNRAILNPKNDNVIVDVTNDIGSKILTFDITVKGTNKIT